MKYIFFTLLIMITFSMNSLSSQEKSFEESMCLFSYIRAFGGVTYEDVFEYDNKIIIESSFVSKCSAEEEHTSYDYIPTPLSKFYENSNTHNLNQKCLYIHKRFSETEIAHIDLCSNHKSSDDYSYEVYTEYN